MQPHVTALVAGLLVIGGVAALGGAGATPHDPEVNGYSVNFTWTPSSTFGSQNQYPGKSDASYEAYSTTEEPGVITELDYIIITSEDLGMSSCNPLDARALGIDRNDDDPGTKTDESLTDHLERNSFSEDRILLKFFDEGDLAGDPVSVRDEDEITSATSACFVNPDEPGWYRVNGLLNGSARNAQGETEYRTFDQLSHYFYICECDSEAEARETLGPRPSVNSSEDPQPTATATAAGTADGTPSATATATTAATATATRTTAATATRTGTATRTASATATRTEAATRTVTGTAAATRTATGTAAPARTTTRVGAGSGGARQASGGGLATPTVADGPGLGTLAALLGVLLTGLCLRPRG